MPQKANQTSFKKGHIVSDETRKRISEATKRAMARPEVKEKLKLATKLWGKEHPNWKGKKVSYAGLHQWVRRALGKAKQCSECGNKENGCHWANVDHKYRRKVEDYKELCVACHWKHDKKNNLRKSK